MRPVLFYIPLHFVSVPIHSYGVMLGLSLVAGWYLTLSLGRRDGLDPTLMGRCYITTAVSAVVGARLLYVFTNLERFDSFFELFKVWQGGLVAYGGFLGGLVGAAVFCWLNGIRLLAWADCAVPSLCTGLMITRIGCMLYGCDFGKPWNGPWAIHFPVGSPAYNVERKEGLLGPDALQSLAVHPTQLYESLNGLVLLGLLLLVRRYRKFSGEMFVAFFMGYAILRYYVETLRADEQRGGIGPFSTSQLIAVVTFAMGGALLAWLHAQWRRDPEAMRLWEDGRAMATSVAPAVAVAPSRKRRKKR